MGQSPGLPRSLMRPARAQGRCYDAAWLASPPVNGALSVTLIGRWRCLGRSQVPRGVSLCLPSQDGFCNLWSGSGECGCEAEGCGGRWFIMFSFLLGTRWCLRMDSHRGAGGRIRRGARMTPGTRDPWSPPTGRGAMPATASSGKVNSVSASRRSGAACSVIGPWGYQPLAGLSAASLSAIAGWALGCGGFNHRPSGSLLLGVRHPMSREKSPA